MINGVDPEQQSSSVFRADRPNPGQCQVEFMTAGDIKRTRSGRPGYFITDSVHVALTVFLFNVLPVGYYQSPASGSRLELIAVAECHGLTYYIRNESRAQVNVIQWDNYGFYFGTG